VKRYNWRAMADLNVGLVVNLTEQPIAPPTGDKQFSFCSNCKIARFSSFSSFLLIT